MSAILILQMAEIATKKPAMERSHLERQALAWHSWFNNPIGTPPVNTENLVRDLRKIAAVDPREKEFKSRGFQSAQEFDTLTDSVNLKHTAIFQMWQTWKNTNGTKEGLMRILHAQRQL